MKKTSNKLRGVKLPDDKPKDLDIHTGDEVTIETKSQYNVVPISLTGNVLSPEEQKKTSRGARQSQALAYNTLPKSLDRQVSIFDAINQDQAILKTIMENNLDKIGAELSVPEQRALGATLELLHNTGAYRRADEKLEAGQRITPEEIVVPLQDFLQAYGLEKTINNRGHTSYSGKEVTDALKGLRGTPIYRTDENGNKVIDRFEGGLTKPVMQVWGLRKGGRYSYTERTYGGLVSSVTEVYYDPSEKQYKKIADGDTSVAIGAKFIRIVPSGIFFTKPFIRYPSNKVRELREYLRGLDRPRRLTTTHYNVLNLLNLEAHSGKGEIVRLRGTMIAQAGLNNEIQASRIEPAKAYKDNRKRQPRRYSRAEGRIKTTLDDMQAIGAVTDHKLERDPLKGKQYRIKIDRQAFIDETETPKKPKKKYKK